MVSVVNSSLQGVSGLGSAAAGVRAPRAAPIDLVSDATDATTAPGNGGPGANTAQDQGVTAPSSAVATAFQAQAIGQEPANAPRTPDIALRARKAAAAYQAATEQTNAGGPASDIQLPGMPPRLASGRMLDLSA